MKSSSMPLLNNETPKTESALLAGTLLPSRRARNESHNSVPSRPKRPLASNDSNPTVRGVRNAMLFRPNCKRLPAVTNPGKSSPLSPVRPVPVHGVAQPVPPARVAMARFAA